MTRWEKVDWMISKTKIREKSLVLRHMPQCVLRSWQKCLDFKYFSVMSEIWTPLFRYHTPFCMINEHSSSDFRRSLGFQTFCIILNKNSSHFQFVPQRKILKTTHVRKQIKFFESFIFIKRSKSGKRQNQDTESVLISDIRLRDFGQKNCAFRFWQVEPIQCQIGTDETT